MSQIDLKLSDVKPEVIAALKAGWKAVGATEERVERMDAGTLMMGPIAVNGLLMGYIDEIHGPTSQQATLPISRFEAQLLARHWIKEILATRARICFDGQVGTRELRWRTYGMRRIDAFIEAGLLTETEIEQIEEDVRQEKGYPPFNEWPSAEPDLSKPAPENPQGPVPPTTESPESPDSTPEAPQGLERRPSWPEDDGQPSGSECPEKG
ncbi:MAG: hypothetical protein ACM359_09480 [Bacillota bacterium]